MCNKKKKKMANFLSMFCEKKVKIRESVDDVLFRRGWMNMDKETFLDEM